MRPPAAGPAPVIAFTEDNMTSLPQWDRQPIVNEAVWQFDYDGSNYNNFSTYIQATSASGSGRGNRFQHYIAGPAVIVRRRGVCGVVDVATIPEVRGNQSGDLKAARRF